MRFSHISLKFLEVQYFDIIVGNEVGFPKARSLGVINDVAICIFSFPFQAAELRIICYLRLNPLLLGALETS